MNKRTQGFTLVELTISIMFLSILMLAILTLTITVGKLYIKGDTLKTVNQVGRDFSDVVRRDFLATGLNGSVPAAVTLNGGTATQPRESGRICLGSAVAYLWNTADLLNDNSPAANAVKVTMGSPSQPVKFVRIVRPQYSYCAAGAPMHIASSESATELFGGTERDYALYSVTFKPMAITAEKGLYEITYALGTNEPGTTEIDSDGYVTCKPDNSILANFSSCSVSHFDMVVRVGGLEK